MSQNQFAYTALSAAGGVAAPSLDANGNLRVALAGEATTTVPSAASSGNVADAAAVAVIPAVAGKTSYVSGISITGAGATAASVVTAALTGLVAPLNFTVPVPAGIDASIAPLVIQFDPPLPASAVDAALTLTLPALGVGNTNAAVSIWGFHQ